MNPIPLEQEDPELGALLADVCTYNASVQKKDRIIVDFETCTIRERTIKSVKVGRNDPCPCGSGKKYKKCCYK